MTAIDPPMRDFILREYPVDAMRRNAKQYRKRANEAFRIYKFLRDMAEDLEALAKVRQTLANEEDKSLSEAIEEYIRTREALAEESES